MMKSTSNSTPYTPPRRNPFQQLSNNVSYSSSPDLPQILDYKSYHSARQSQAGFNDNISPESHADSCTSGGSTVLEHSEYRRLAIQKNRDSRRFDDEFEILSPTPVPSGIYADIHHHCEKTEVGPWRLGRTLGRGASGSVRLARNVETNQLGAVKIMSKEYVRRVMIEKGREKTKYFWTNSMEREIIIMKMIRHPNVLRMYDVWENKYELYLVLEYIDGGDLYDYMISRGRLSEFEAIKIFVQILSGLDYCHHFSICHRDLKPENILLDKNQNVRLADFGFAALQPPGWKLARSCGTPHYAAPEVICGVKYNGGTADIWSCGVVLFTLLCGHVPFDDDDTVALLQKVKFGKFEMPKHLSLDAQDLIRRMLIVNPEKRINTDEIWRHPLITRYFDEGERTARKSAPSYEEIAKPVSSAEIDRVILESMRSLWFGVEPEVIKQALLSPEPNQEKVFYALLEKYRDENEEHFCSQFKVQLEAGQHNNSKRSIRTIRSASSVRSMRSMRSLKSSKSSTSTPRSGSHEGNCSKAHISRQHLDQINEESAIETESDDETWIDETWTDETWTDESSVKACSKGGSHLRFFEDSFEAVTVSNFMSGASRMSEPPGKSHSRNLRTITYGKRSGRVILKHLVRNKQRTDCKLEPWTDNHDTSQGDAKQADAQGNTSYIGYSQRIMGRKEALALAKKRNRLSTISIFSRISATTMPPLATCRRANLQKEHEDAARKASRELAEHCEIAFNITSLSPMLPKLPFSLPSSAVLDETAAELECSFAYPHAPVGLPAGMHNENSSFDRPLPALPSSWSKASDEERPKSQSTLKSDKLEIEENQYLDEVIAHLDEIEKYEDIFISKPRNHSTERRAFSEDGSVQLSENCSQHDYDIKAEPCEAQGCQWVRSISDPNAHPSIPMHDPFHVALLEYHHGPIGPNLILPIPRSVRPIRSNITPTSSCVQRRRENAQNIENIDSISELQSHSLRLPKATGLRTKISAIFDSKLNTVGLLQPATRESKTSHESRASQQNGGALEVKSIQEHKHQGFWSSIGLSFTAKGQKKKIESDANSSTKGFCIWNRGSKRNGAKVKNGSIPHSDTLAEQSWIQHEAEEPVKEPVPFEEIKPQWFQRIFNLHPASHIICFKTNAIGTRREILRIFNDWNRKKLGLVGIITEKRYGTITAKVAKRNALNVRPVTFMVEIRPYGGNGAQAKSVARVLQLKGAASSLRRVVQELVKVCKRSKILVEDNLETSLMETRLESEAA